MGDHFQRNVIDARQSSRWTLHQAREFPAVPLRQMPPGGANLLFNQIEVVEQPFPGRRNPAVCLYRLRQQIVDADQDAFILGQSCQKAIRSVSGT